MPRDCRDLHTSPTATTESSSTKLTTSLLPTATRQQPHHRRLLESPTHSNNHHIALRRESAERKSHHLISTSSQLAQRAVQKASTSLPGTPNLSQLRRPLRVQYKKLSLDVGDDEQQQQPQHPFAPMSATHLQRQAAAAAAAAVTSVCGTSHEQQMIIPDQLLTALGDEDDALGRDKTMQTRAMAASQRQVGPMLRQDACVQVEVENNNNNNNNDINMSYAEASGAASISTQTQTELASLMQCGINNNNNNNNDQSSIPLPTASSTSASSVAPNLTPTVLPAFTSSTQMTPPINVNKSSLAFCEHCCERASALSSNGSTYAQGAHAVLGYAAARPTEDSDRLYRVAADSVSDLSSYRFISDEDEFGVRAVSESSPPPPPPPPLPSNYNKRNNKRKAITALTSVNKNASHSVHASSSPTTTATSAPPQASSIAESASAHGAPTRIASPTICCYTIEKAASVHYNATVVEYVQPLKTAPVPIPTFNDTPSVNREVFPSRSEENILSTSLPSNYGSERSSETLNYRHLQSIASKHLPPTPPPKPRQGSGPSTKPDFPLEVPNSYIPNSERLYTYGFASPQLPSNVFSYDPHSFQRRILKLENESAYGLSVPAVGGCRVVRGESDSGSVERHSSERLSRSLERSISPEHCELLNCFGTSKNTPSAPQKNGEFDSYERANGRRVPGDAHSKREYENAANVNNNATTTNFVACVVSSSSCLPVASEKCAIVNNKNNQHRQQPHEHIRSVSGNNYNPESVIKSQSVGSRKGSITSSSGSAYTESNNNNYNCKIKHRHQAHDVQSLPSPVAEFQPLSHLASPLPKRTLLYDSHGRLKSERISYLPTPLALANGRKSASESRLHGVHRNFANGSRVCERITTTKSATPLTPTFKRKFNYLSDRFEPCVPENEEECEQSVLTPPTSPGLPLPNTITTIAELHGEQISTESGLNATVLIPSHNTQSPESTPLSESAHHLAFEQSQFPREGPHAPNICKSFSDSQNFVSLQQAQQALDSTNNNNNNSNSNHNVPERCSSEYSLKSNFPNSDSGISCKCASKHNPHSPTTTDTTTPTSPLSPISLTSSGLSHKNHSHSLPSVPHSTGTQSPLWVSSETIESRFSEQRGGPDDIHSNCSDQTTIFHLENDCTHSTNYSQTSLTPAGVNTVLRSPIILKRIPAIQSFGYIPTYSSSLDSANVRENGGGENEEITMEKRRNTLDRFPRLGFGRKSTPAASAGASQQSQSPSPSQSASQQQQSEGSSGSTRNRKSSEKSEKLRELTELLRGNRSSPTPPPVPPPRRPRNGSQSASNSFERSDTQTATAAQVTKASGGTSGEANAPLSFVPTRNDDIMLMDQDEQAADTPQHHAEASKTPSGDDNLHPLRNVNTEVQAGATAAKTSATRLYDKLKPNTSMTNFETLLAMGREKSKSPPPLSPSAASRGGASFDSELANRADITTTLTRPESRTVIGSYAQKGIPYRSASFSQSDLSAAKYKKSSWVALRDRLWRDKVVGSADSATNSNVTSASATTENVNKDKPKEPDWVYIPLKKKTEMSINLNYGQEIKNLDSPDAIPEEDIFGTDTEQTSSITDDPKDILPDSNIVIAHAKMESLTDTIHSENDYAIEEHQVPATVETVAAVVEASEEAKEKAQVIEQPTVKEPTKTKLETLEPNVATEMEERIPLESPPDNFLQTATTCLIPVPVFECAAQEWGMENPPQEWVEVAPEELGVIPETIVPIVLEKQCAVATAETKTEKEYRAENVPIISVSRSSEEADDKCILRRKEHLELQRQEALCERRQGTASYPEVKKRYSHDDMEIGKDMRVSLEAIASRHSADERKRIDKSKRRKGMYIDNAAWSDSPDGGPNSRGLALDISIAIKPETPEECGIMYINSPPTDDNYTPGSLYSPDLNTPEAECRKAPVWTKSDRLSGLNCQSSEEKDDGQVSDTCGRLPRSHKSFPYLRAESASDNESDQTPPNSRDRASPSPVPGDYDFKRYSKRPVRGPLGGMLEAEMKKPNKRHFEGILEVDGMREAESTTTTQPRRQRAAQDDANCGISTAGSAVRNLPHHSNSMRVRKTNSCLPVPAHARAASTPSQIENVSKSGGGIDKINPHEKRYQSTLDNSLCDDKDCHEPGPHYYHHHPHHHQRDMKRAASEAPAPKGHHSKRSQSMGGHEKTNEIVHQQKRSLDVTSKHKGGASAAKGGNVVPSQKLLAELLQGSSEKSLTEQRQQMSADTRTHVVQEIFRNEQSYVESLQTIVTKYLKVLKSPEHAGMIDSRTVDEIFFMVPDILEIHEKFLTELRSRLDNWDANQKVGDAFMETFSKLEVLEVYTCFVNNCNRAKNAIRSTKHQRPSFAKFLETTAREHKGKLTLDNLLIKPVQKFPNYEMLFQRLIKHTDLDHPDQKHLQDVLKLVHEILVHINCKEREILENGQREATLRELEGVIEGITDLIAPDRQFLLFDLVSMPSGQGARKERGFFLFNDLLVLTSIKKRSGTIRKPNTNTCPGTVASTLDTNKYKFLTKISLDCLEIVKTKDENVKRIMNEIQNLAEDCNKLQQIADITASLKYSHQYLEDVIRELLREVQRQLSERQTNDAQLNMLELMVNSPNGSQKLSVVFSKADKRTQWEETFNEAKQKLAATLERHPIPEFLMSIPIRKTRAGLQFTCAAATLSDKRDVWVCNSDGYVGQVCIMSLYPEPNVTSCNGVCNARILCVASVPAYSPNSSNAAASAQQLTQQLRQQQLQQDRNSATSTPQHSYTQQLRDYRKSISPNCQPPSAIGTPEKKKTPSGGGSTSNNNNNNNGNGNGHNNSDIQLDLNLSSSDEEADASGVGVSGGGSGGGSGGVGASGATTASGSVGSSGTTASSSGSGTTERVPSPAPSTQTTASCSTASTAVVGGASFHSHQDSNPEESEGNLSTMWIGTEDGCIHVYNSTDNIRIKKNRIKIEHQSAVYSILYLDNRVFVALANGDICVYLRDGVAWNTSSSHCLSIGTVTSPITKLLNVHGKLWCSIQGIIKVLDVETLLVVNQIQISSDSKPITNMTVSNNYVWISIQNSAHIKCFHSISHQLITEVNLAPAVNKMLSNCDEIIRQHKAACLRVTSLLSCRDLIWIGTSAGVLLTIPAQGYEKGAPNIVPTGIPHGHTGHVRFLTFVETSGLSAEGSGSSTTSSNRESEGVVTCGEIRSQGSFKHSKPKTESSNILIISGGDGYEDFRNSGNSLSEIAGREDSTNHLLIWQI